ncbi:hypothetical protein TNCV_4106361 [Trichonephila clavipes]|nr:hypothetical protein TNCV_4106361 [Trichonephila clavipes]
MGGRSEHAPVNRLVISLFGDIAIGQGWRTSGTRAIDGTRRNILGTPPIKKIRGVPVGPRPDAVALYSGCTPGKSRAWFCHTASLVGLRAPRVTDDVGYGNRTARWSKDPSPQIK